MSHFKNKFFENRIRWQLHSLINWILYPEFRSSWNLKKVLYSNKWALTSLMIFLLIISSSYFIGRVVSNDVICDLKEVISGKDSTISKLSFSISDKNEIISDLSIEMKSRKYLEFKIIDESKITYIENLRQVPDSIFFLMESEARKYDIPYVIFFRIMEKESKFQFISNSEGSGAFGYMQVMPSTYERYRKKLNISAEHTPGNNVRVAANLIYSMREFWKTKFKDDRKIWEYTLAEYGCGRQPMMDGNGGYFIPESVRPGVNYVMKCYK